MLGWLWALEGWQFVAGLLTCIAGLVGTFIAGVAAMAKTITSSTEHDLYTCTCIRCQKIRNKAADKYGVPLNQPKALFEWSKNQKLKYGGWLPTSALTVGMLLTSNKGHIYKVEEIHPRDYGLALHLRNMSTKRLAWVTVHSDRLEVPMWRQAFYDERE
jgi:hypothetical protein